MSRSNQEVYEGKGWMAGKITVTLLSTFVLMDFSQKWGTEWLRSRSQTKQFVCVADPMQAVVAGIQQAHAEQLANMRIQDLNVSLKPLNSVNNPILRKRKLLG